jgi:hypothetical protein
LRHDRRRQWLAADGSDKSRVVHSFDFWIDNKDC